MHKIPGDKGSGIEGDKYFVGICPELIEEGGGGEMEGEKGGYSMVHLAIPKSLQQNLNVRGLYCTQDRRNCPRHPLLSTIRCYTLKKTREGEKGGEERGRQPRRTCYTQIIEQAQTPPGLQRPQGWKISPPSKPLGPSIQYIANF